MGFLRIRTTVDERPGRLASLAAALAARGGNILGLSVQSDSDGTVDEFVADIPAHPEAVREALEAAGGRRVQVVPATAHELTDEPTRALLLASRLRAMPWRLPELLAELLRADDARWIYGEAVSDLPDPTQLVVPVAPRRAVRLRRTELPFTLTEAARAASFARLAQPPVEQPAGERADQAGRRRRDHRSGRSPRSTARPYATCTTGARPRRAGSATSPPCPRCRPGCSTGSATAAADTRWSPGTTDRWWRWPPCMFTADPGIAEMAFLVEDRWQGRGLGAVLARMLVGEARDLGYAEVRATMLSDNVRMRRLLVSLGATLGYTEDPGVVEARLPVGAVAPV